jgi:cysteine synthase A
VGSPAARLRHARGGPGRLLCDGGERYAHTYYDEDWLAERGLDIAPYAAALEEFSRTGDFVTP